MPSRSTMLVTTAALLIAGLSGAGGPDTRRMPWCGAHEPAPTRAPDGPPSSLSPGACRARATLVQRSAAIPSPGYHHLGATTKQDYSGVLGRLEVRDPGVRRDSFDFVATRFMAKADSGSGVAWLEAGWTETGWDGGDRQRVYTYDTNRDAWSFYDQYDLKDADRVWIYLQHSDQQWQAWLWWADSWHLLAGETLPVPASTQIEQYVEVYADPKLGGSFPVPPVQLDNVRLRDDSGALIPWNAQIPTSSPADDGAGIYCLKWTNRFDTWQGGDC